MIDCQKQADEAKTAIDAMINYATDAESAFKRITELARNIDEDNWKNTAEEIFDIAYNHY